MTSLILDVGPSSNFHFQPNKTNQQQTVKIPTI